MNIKSLLAAFSVLMFAAGSLSGAEYKVSSAAEVSALKSLKPGDVVIFGAGTYKDQKMVLKAKGTPDAPIVFKAEQPGRVVFTGDSQLQMSGTGMEVSGFWFKDVVATGKCIVEMKTTASKLTQCAITGKDTPQDKDTDYKWVSVYGENNTVDGCSFIDKKNIGCLFVVWFEEGKTPGHTITNNYFSRPTVLYEEDGKSKINGQEALRIGTSHHSMSSGNCTVEGNTFYRCDAEIEVISNKSWNNIYRRNLFLECQGALTLRHGNYGVVENNYFIGNGLKGTGGVRVIGTHQKIRNNYFENLGGMNYYSAVCLIQGVKDSPLNRYFQVTDTEVTGNTIINCREGIVVSYGSSPDQSLPVISTIIEDNLIYNDKASNVAIRSIDKPYKPEVTWKNNTVFGGKYEGITAKEVPTTKEKPVLPDVTAIWKAIETGAGVNWSLSDK